MFFLPLVFPPAASGGDQVPTELIKRTVVQVRDHAVRAIPGAPSKTYLWKPPNSHLVIFVSPSYKQCGGTIEK